MPRPAELSSPYFPKSRHFFTLVMTRHFSPCTREGLAKMTIAPDRQIAPFDAPLEAHVDTRAVHAGRADLAGLGVHVPPIDFSTTNPLPDVALGGDSYEAMAAGGLP